MKYETTKLALTSLRDSFIDHTVKHKLPFSLSDLGGACGICSLLAFRKLKRMGYRPVFHMNYYHCFVTVEDYYVDLTLSQFVPHVGPLFFENHPYRIETGRWGFVHRSKKKDRATTERAIRKLFRGWDSAHNPFKQPLPKLPKTTRLTKAETGV
jgi:hypothetical protein